MSVDLSEYNDVAARIAEFKTKHPDGSFQPADLGKPYWLETIPMVNAEGELFDKVFIVYAAAAYRSPDDTHPGIGLAWEPFPGTTNFTRNSELQNAETSAWGRAIIAALASDAKKIASAEEVRNRSEESDEGASRPARAASSGAPRPSDKQIKFINDLLSQTGLDLFADLSGFIGREITNATELTGAEGKRLIDHLISIRDGKTPKPERAPEPQRIEYAAGEEPF